MTNTNDSGKTLGQVYAEAKAQAQPIFHRIARDEKNSWDTFLHQEGLKAVRQHVLTTEPVKGLAEALRNAKSALIQLADRPVHYYVDQAEVALAAYADAVKKGER